MDKAMRCIAIILMVIGVGIVLASVEISAGISAWVILGTGAFGIALCYAGHNMFLVWGGEEFLDSPFKKADWHW